METGDINNFLALVGAAELEDSKPKVAPFGMKKTETQKVIFRSCRAKNFRSIGNEFMQIDFDKAKSTLVVSEDNGSGKSTLAVWAPYYALFDKAYAPKEKKGGLINSSTRKDMLVEIRFSTKGKEYLVRRGAKPTIFEILYMAEDGSWVKIEEEAAQRDQQAFLENILGFDSKIAENVMILGADKFTPFVEMDAPSRRHVVEQIWDLSVFPVMLKFAKEDLAVIERDRVEKSGQLDNLKHRMMSLNSQEGIIAGNSETIAQLFQAAEAAQARCKEQEALLISIPLEYERDRQAAQSELDVVGQELEALKAGVAEKFEVRLTEAELVLADAKATAQKAEARAVESVDLGPLVAAVSEAEDGKARDAEAIKHAGHAEYLSLLPAVEVAEQEAATAEAALRASRTYAPGEYLIAALEAAEGNVKAAGDALETAAREVSEIGTGLASCLASQDKLSSQLTDLNRKKEFFDGKREALDKKVAEFSHLGQCPTCRQLIGEEAIEQMKQSLAQDYAELDTFTINEEISQANEALTEMKTDQTDYECELDLAKNTEKEAAAELEYCRQLLQDLKAQRDGEERTFNAQTEELVADARVASSEKVSQAKAAVKAVADATKIKLLKCDSDWAATIEERKTALATSESAQRAKVAEVRAASQRDISAAEAVVTNIKSDYNSEFHQASAELSARSQALAAQLKELSSRATIAQGIAVDTLAENQVEHDTLTKQATAAREKNDAQRQAITEEVGATQADITAADAKLNQLTLKASTYRHLITNELGDKAAKADIIKAYMPFLNQKINEYLAGMNMFLGFRIDENFEIEFTSPDRKGQTTFSLSKGQLTRVNLAVLFGLRDVANLKASVDTNLLVMDETIEPLSEQGVREIMEMMSHKFSSMNILVVSQRASEFGEYFKDTIRYGLRGGFTTQL